MAATPQEKIFPKLLFICALTSTLVVILVGIFILLQGYPVLVKTGFFSFLFGQNWLPKENIFGILPMVVGTIVVTFCSLLLGVPLGLATAVFLAELAPRGVDLWTRRAVELLAGIPSVVYGLFGMTIIVPLVRSASNHWFGRFLAPEMKTGYGIVAASLVLAIMILPTIVNISEDALRSVPREYAEGSFALGVTHWQTIVNVLIPAARSGIIAGVVLGMGRAIGETMAIIMVAGNSPAMPHSIFSPVRTMSGNIGLEMGYASGSHAQALFATGVVLFIFIMLLNSVALTFNRKRVRPS
jgi:phosphate transport system permease protein